MPKPRLWQRMRAAISPRTSAARPIFNVVEQTGAAPAEVYLYGDVVDETPTDWWTGEPIEGLYISLQNVLGELERVRNASEMVIHLNSSGGDLFAGIAIHNLLREFGGKKTIVVDGLAASAASVILCAGDTVQVHPGSMVMIHNVLSLLWGYYSTTELRELITSHEAAELSIKRIYEGKCKKPQDELQQLIDATTWFVGQDAIDAGFADEMIEREEDEDPEQDAPPVAAELDGEYLMVAGVPHLIANLGALPPWLSGPTKIPDVAAAAHGYKPVGGATQAPRQEEEDGMPITNTAELRSTYPDLVAAIEAEQAATERQRIRDIQDIANQIRNHELVNRAMFDEPMTAQDLAYAALQADGKAAQGFLAALDTDTTEDEDDEDEETSSPANSVKPLPAVNDVEEIDAAAEQAMVNEAVTMFNQMNGRG